MDSRWKVLALVACMMLFSLAAASVLLLYAQHREAKLNSIEYWSAKIPECATYSPRQHTVSVPDERRVPIVVQVFTDNGWSNVTTEKSNYKFIVRGECRAVFIE